MVRRANKIILGAIIFMAWSCHNAISMEWRERSTDSLDLDENREDSDKMRCLGPFSELCKVNREFPDGLINYFPKKSIFRNGPMSSHCTCQMVRKPLDLGPSYYPRFLDNWACKNNACGMPHRCNERKYSVKVLKLKEYNEEDKKPLCFAPNFLKAWVPETLSVVVGCESVPNL